MSLHPKFDADSSCLNCAAFEKWSPSANSEIRGVCHRHAPRPSVGMDRFDSGGELTASTEMGMRSAEWPWVNNDSRMFCCEWLPKPPEKKP